MVSTIWPDSLCLITLLVCWSCVMVLALGDNDQQVEVKIDKRVTVVPPGSEVGHAMLQMVRHPDGSIYVNMHALGLFKSTDEGETWTQIPLNNNPGGLGVSSDGRLWLVHQSDSAEVFVSNSADGGKTWQTREVDFGSFAPTAPEDPYTIAGVSNCYVNFIERPDGTLMFSLSLRYPDWADFLQEDQTRPGLGDVMIRSTDGGQTWGDPTVVHQHTTETDYAVDPNNPDHVLAITRKQRALLRGEDRATVEQITGCAPGYGWVYKQGLLLESTNGSRTFSEVPGSLTDYYEHRGTILWTNNNVVVVTHEGGIPGISSSDGRLLARISMNGGQTWVDGTKTGTPLMNQSRKFVLLPSPPPSIFYTSPTVELSANHFLTMYVKGDIGKVQSVEAVFWHIEAPVS